MSYTPEQSAIKTDASLEARIAKATSQAEVQQIMREAALDQKLVVPDAYDPNVLLQVEPGTAPRKFARAVTINGQKHVLEADSELALEKAETELYRTQLQTPAAEHAAPVQHDDSHGTDSAVDEQQKAMLLLQFQTGQIDAATYIEKSGAVGEYLEKQGIDVDALRETSQAAASRILEKSWEQATDEFLRSPEGASWPGGEANLNRIGEILVENDLVDAEDKVEALRAAAEFMRKENLFVANPEAEADERVRNATSVEQIREIVRPGGSSIFGR